MSLENRFAPLPSEVRRRRAQAEAEAAFGVTWRDNCPPEVGRKVLTALRQVTNALRRVLYTADTHRLINSASGVADVSSYDVLDGQGDDDERLDVIAAVVLAFVWLSENDSDKVSVSEWGNRGYEPPTYDSATFLETVNDLLLGARVE